MIKIKEVVLSRHSQNNLSNMSTPTWVQNMLKVKQKLITH
jgi:hypothetical protein